MSPLYIGYWIQNESLTINSTNCPKAVIIHITWRDSFIVLYSLHSLYPSVIRLHEYAHHHGDVATAHWTRVHNSKAVRAALAKARMSAGYQREPLARCHETHFTSDVCGCIYRSVWRRGRRSWCSCCHLISVVVAVAARRLQRRRVSAHGMTNGTQELESRIRTRYRTWQDRTWLSTRLWC